MAAQQLQFKWDQPSSSKGEACGGGGKVCQVAAASERTEPVKTVMMEEVVRRENLIKALKRVCANKGSPGVDGMTVDELKGYLKTHWPDIREKPTGATMDELMRRIGITNPWGSRGEGITYYSNAMATFQLLDPVLSTGDIAKVEEFFHRANSQDRESP